MPDGELQIRIAHLEERQRELATDLRDLGRRIQQMDTHGTAVTKVKLDNIEKAQEDMREDIASIGKILSDEAKDKRNDRRAIAAALIAAAGAVLVAIIGWLAGGNP